MEQENSVIEIRFMQYDMVRQTLADQIKAHLFETFVEDVTSVDGTKNFHEIIKEIAEMSATGRAINIQMKPEQGEKGIIYKIEYDML